MKALLNNLNFFREKIIYVVSVIALIFFSTLYFYIYKLDVFKDFQVVLAAIFLLILLLITFFFFKVSRQVYNLFFQTKLKIAGHQLHQKLAILFSAVCLMPALIISAFSIITLNTALEGWFSKKISTAVSQSVEVANQYLLEHQNAMRGEILDFANQLNVNAIKFSSNKKKINDFLDFYVGKNNLTDAVLIDSSRNVLAHSKYSFEINYYDLPDKFYNLASNGKIALANDKETNKLKAFMKLNNFVDAYLLVSRFVDKNVLAAIEKTSIAASDYQTIELNKFDIKISFLVLFILISFLLLLISLYVGFGLANRLTSPIAELIFASEEIGRGNLNFKIENQSLVKNNVTELKRLGDAFNKMILDIKISRTELIEANDQLDKRRQFSEAVLSGVYSGVIGLDNKFKINLSNITAKNLLNISINDHYKHNLVDIIPEFKPLINKINLDSRSFVEEKIVLFRDGKKLILISRIVKQSKENKTIGYVITFEDLTELIDAQKKAAWSDVARKIAHEIKNPLTPIKLGAERLKNINYKSLLDENKYTQTIDMILRQVDDIRHLIDEFSSFARMPKLKMKKVNFCDFVKLYVDSILTSYSNVKFIYKNKYKKIYAMIDEIQLRQVLTNIVKNSSENFEENKITNGKIKISILKIKSFLEICIEDNGSGIKASIKDNLMEPYHTSKIDGTGLGLSISKKIIEDHNGSINISSLNKGVLVSIKLPLLDEKEVL